MKKSPFCGGEDREGSPRAKKSNLSPATRICFERETIVHTHSSKFREVVHQLTGAESSSSSSSSSNDERAPPFGNGLSRNEKNMLTNNDSFSRDVGSCSGHLFATSRHDNALSNGGFGRDVSVANSIKDRSFGAAQCDGFVKADPFQLARQDNVGDSDGAARDFVGSSSHEMHARRSDSHASGKSVELEASSPLGLRLFERRRSSSNYNKSVGRLSTSSCKDLPALASGPLTPLACEFEKICFSRTPTDCPTDNNPKPISSEGGTYTDLQLSSSAADSSRMDISVSTEPDTDSNRSLQLSAEDVAIASKGFFLHSERPRNSELTLLALFPESPRNS